MAEQLNSLLLSAIAPSTRLSYTRSWDLFGLAMEQLHIPYDGIGSLPLSKQQILTFIGYLNVKNYAPTTIITYVSGLSYVHKMKGFEDPCASFVVQKFMAGALKINPSIDTRLPITLGILVQLVDALKNTTSSPYLRSLFKAMYLVSFFGLMRVGEVTTDIGGVIPLMSDQVRFASNYAVITIKHFKHNNSAHPMEIVITKQAEVAICPVTALIDFFHLRGTQYGPLFCMTDLEVVPRSFYLKHLKFNLGFCGLNTKLYLSHSFRIGGASFYASIGFSDEQIRVLGRWKHCTFRKYIRCQRILASF